MDSMAQTFCCSLSFRSFLLNPDLLLSQPVQLVDLGIDQPVDGLDLALEKVALLLALGGRELQVPFEDAF